MPITNYAPYLLVADSATFSPSSLLFQIHPFINHASSFQWPTSLRLLNQKPLLFPSTGPLPSGAPEVVGSPCICAHAVGLGVHGRVRERLRVEQSGDDGAPVHQLLVVVRGAVVVEEAAPATAVAAPRAGVVQGAVEAVGGVGGGVLAGLWDPNQRGWGGEGGGDGGR